jgi:hypothetical protein
MLIADSMEHFKYYDDCLMKAYRHSEPVFNLRYLNDCIEALKNMIRKGHQSSIIYKSYLDSFGFSFVEKVRKVCDTILNETRKFPQNFINTIAENENVTSTLITN